MTGNPLIAIRSALIEKTRKGRVQDWVERMAAIAVTAGIPLEHIAWQNSPINVAFAVVQMADQRGKLDDLLSAIQAFSEE